MMSFAFIVTIAASSVANPDVSPMEVRFSNTCVVERAAWANDRLCLLIRNSLCPDRGMVVYVKGGKLYRYSGEEDLSDVCGIGRYMDGGLLIVTRLRLSPGRIVFGLYTESEYKGRSLGAIDLCDEETSFTFLPSKAAMFITNKRLGDAGTKRPSSRELNSNNLKISLRNYDGCADISNDRVLAATSPSISMTAPLIRGELWWIDAATGEVTPANLQPEGIVSQERRGSAGLVFDRENDRVTGILADPQTEGRYYVAIGDMRRGGRLLRIRTDGQSEVIFRRQSGPFHQIAGIPIATSLGSVSAEEPVLGISCDAQKNVWFITPRGMYRIGSKGPEFVGEPIFERTGDFYTTGNTHGFILVHPRHVDASKDVALWRIRVFMVALPQV